jgi:hypothetical protein
MLSKDKSFKEPYEVIVKKLELAELTIELGDITRQKWERLATMKDILKREEELILKITNITKELQLMSKGGD